MTDSRLLVGCTAAGGALPSVEEPFSVRLRGGTIADVGDLRPDVDEAVLDLSGAFLVAGSVDAHVHLALGGDGVTVGETVIGGERAAPSPARGRRAADRTVGPLPSPSPVENARRHLAAGVTAVRDLGGGGLRLGGDLASAGGLPGVGLPRVVGCEGALTRSGRYGGFLGAALAPGEDLAAAVRERVGAGARTIKVILTGSVDFDRGTVDPPHFSFGELKTMVDAAHALGLPVAVHANGPAAVKLAAKAGADSIEHGIMADEAALGALASSDSVWVPTLAPLYVLAGTGRWPGLPRIMAAHEEMVARGASLGVRVAAGTDAGSPGVPHGALFTEISLLRRAGLTPAAARDAATHVAADLLGLPGGYGRLAPGAATDLVWYGHDPFASAAPGVTGTPQPLGMLRMEQQPLETTGPR